MKKRILIIAVLITVAAILRTIFFGQTPPSLNWDEASLGYNAYSILKTGKDEWGKTMPLTFEAFGDYKLPGYIYTAVPFVALVGLNEFGVRLPSLIAGILSVGILFLIIFEISKNKIWAFSASLLLAVSPWAVFLSRAALEANLALCLFLAGVYCLVCKFKNFNFFYLSSLFFGLTLFTYNSARVFVPLFLFVQVLANYKYCLQNYKKLIIPVLLFLIFFTSAAYLASTQDSASRYYWVAILDDGAINQINQLRGASTFGPILTKIIYNRPAYFVYHFFLNYLSHFSPSFLFFEGGTNYQFSVPHTGLLYLVELPFLIFGAVAILKKKKLAIMLLAWVFLAPIPAAITRESPHVLRSIFILGGLQAITGFGIWKVFACLRNKNYKMVYYFVPVLLFLLAFEAKGYFENYFFKYPLEYSQAWQYGYKQAFEYIKSRENLNSRPLYISKRYGEAHIFYLFFTKYEPKTYQNNPNLTRFSKSNWRWVDRLDNIYFINDWEVKDKLKHEHGYLISTEKNYPGIPPILKRIQFLDGSTAFEIVEI